MSQKLSCLLEMTENPIDHKVLKSSDDGSGKIKTSFISHDVGMFSNIMLFI